LTVLCLEQISNIQKKRLAFANRYFCFWADEFFSLLLYLRAQKRSVFGDKKYFLDFFDKMLDIVESQAYNNKLHYNRLNYGQQSVRRQKGALFRH